MKLLLLLQICFLFFNIVVVFLAVFYLELLDLFAAHVADLKIPHKNPGRRLETNYIFN